MDKIDLNIPDELYDRLNDLYPETKKSSTVGERAIALVKFYYWTQDNNCEFFVPTGGVDLEILTNGKKTQIEIKGTADRDISWTKLKVSGKPSHDLLVQGMPLYRVCGVYDREPTIYIMFYDKDYEMVPEPRWSLRPRRTA